MKITQERNKEFFFAMKIISLLTAPLIVLYVALLLGNRKEIENNSSYFFIFILVALLLPMIMRLIQYFRYRINLGAIGILTQNNRDPIYLTAFISGLISYILFNAENLDNVVWFNNSIIISIYCGFFFIVNRFFDKASQHAVAFTLACIYLTDRVDRNFLILIFFLPLVWLSRYYLKAHSYKQLILGTLIGVFVGVISINLFR